ncbi:PLP-dependent aminotransferase family protein [Myroides sp. WP-1]|uniref:aminotransferase-like domain-containing protein n=1 Tax=Myroides sp. WP-1 TaxID=2759944 RepID=UPI0015FB829B|nr:PLP-dependent aminotransferase family protein [Myroides sp. WP-1]
MKKYRYEIFTVKIEEDIRQGRVKAGDALPSVRQIKAAFNLSTSSVQSGYDYLVFKGLVKSIPRSGYVVASHIQMTTTVAPDLPQIPRDAVFSSKLALTSTRLAHSEQPSFHIAAPALTFIPQQLVLKTMQEVIREKGSSLLHYYPNAGSSELRTLIQQRATIQGTAIQEGELLLTDGALQALYIALAAVTSPNDIVAVESPCIFSVLEVIASLRLRALEIPVHPLLGFDTLYLDKMCQQHAIKAVVLTPNFHNPTGVLLSDEKKEELYTLAVKYQIPLLENDIYGDLHFQGERPINIKKFDKKGMVLTFSSYSKTIAPGLRLGWLAAGPYFAQAERIKFALGRSVSPINQEVVIKLLRQPSYEKHLRQFRQNLERQAMQFYRIFQTHFPSDYTQQPPKGGYSMWGQIPSSIDPEVFYNHCQALGLGFTPGETFSYGDVYKRNFRAIFAQRLSATDLALLKKLGEALK